MRTTTLDRDVFILYRPLSLVYREGVSCGRIIMTGPLSGTRGGWILRQRDLPPPAGYEIVPKEVLGGKNYAGM